MKIFIFSSLNLHNDVGMLLYFQQYKGFHNIMTLKSEL